MADSFVFHPSDDPFTNINDIITIVHFEIFENWKISDEHKTFIVQKIKQNKNIYFSGLCGFFELFVEELAKRFDKRYGDNNLTEFFKAEEFVAIHESFHGSLTEIVIPLYIDFIKNSANFSCIFSMKK